MSHAQARILIADNIPSNVQLLRDALCREGYTVIVAMNGEDALMRIQTDLPDLIILDHNVLDIDGLTICQRVKSDPLTRSIPVIMMTGKGDVETRIRALEAGCDDFLTKPPNWVELRVRARVLIRMRQLHDHLQRTNLELLQMQRMRDDLVHTITHDLKSPLSTVIGALELLAANLDEVLDGYNRQLIDTALQASQRQNALIEDMLDIIRMEAGEMPIALQAVMVGPLIEKCVAEAMPIAQRRGLVLTTDIAPDLAPARADSGLLKRIVTNLLENAIRSTPEGGTIHISAIMHGGEIRLTVLDSGRPIPEEFQEAVFDPHRQAEIRGSGLRTGMGLGLAFCRLAVNAMHGSIWVESPDNSNTAFHFTLLANSL